MSGIVGILNLDGAPADRQSLQRLTDFLTFRGPDAQSFWSNGPIGFGHALLRTADESASESQPITFDGRVWIVADARIDGRKELAGKLCAAGRPADLSRPDVELLLHAYHAWGEDLVHRIIGDFCFAIWNEATRTLFCARDQMGMRPFYFARTGKSFLFSNTLDCLRRHQDVSSRLNDLAIADFLLFDCSRDLSTTSFADISRLPPAHTLRCAADKFAVRRYWSLAERVKETPNEYRNPQECVEQFRAVLDASVSDRLRSNTACLSLSGGLDSPTVAASARRVLERRGSHFDLWAHTIVYERLFEHGEQYYSGLVADALQIDRKLFVADEDRIFGEYAKDNYSTPEPTHAPMGWAGGNPLPAITRRGRVLLTGLGADPVLASLRSRHIRERLQRRELFGLAKDLAMYLSAEGRFSRLYLRMNWTRWFRPKDFQEPYPQWINPDLEKRFDLRGRWNEVAITSNPSDPSRCVRPEAFAAVTSARCVPIFEATDGGSTRFPVEVRHPFFDLRVMEFLLALPGMPWCSDKQILREAGRGVLPDPVRLRVKSPLVADPIVKALQRPDSKWVDGFKPAPSLDAYVIRKQIPPLVQEQDTVMSWVHLRPLSLNFWLQRMDNLNYQ